MILDYKFKSIKTLPQFIMFQLNLLKFKVLNYKLKSIKILPQRLCTVKLLRLLHHRQTNPVNMDHS